jgi:hypothetical protein
MLVSNNPKKLNPVKTLPNFLRLINKPNNTIHNKDVGGKTTAFKKLIRANDMPPNPLKSLLSN